MLKRHGGRADGFTLLEMVVTMGIFAILVAVGVPGMRTWVSNVKVRAVADTLQNGLRLAQSESLRRSRQVVFSLTSSSTPQNGFTAAVGGGNWAVNTIPSMTDGSDAGTPSFVDSGVLTTSANVQITPVPSQASICFNSAGRLTPNGTSGVTNITGGATCAYPPTPANHTAPMQLYNITLSGADHPLQVQVSLGGQVHLCDPSKTLSATNPDGC